MFNFDSSGTMLIKNLVTAFQNGDINLDEVWDIINKEMKCQHYGDRCVGISHICPCSQEVHN